VKRRGVYKSGSPVNAGVAELADALDSKSSDRKIVWVRSPPPAIYLFLSKARSTLAAT
jgi:hypothetical protein